MSLEEIKKELKKIGPYARQNLIEEKARQLMTCPESCFFVSIQCCKMHASVTNELKSASDYELSKLIKGCEKPKPNILSLPQFECFQNMKPNKYIYEIIKSPYLGETEKKQLLIQHFEK